MFVHSARTHGAMLELKHRRKKIQDLLGFNQKIGKNVTRYADRLLNLVMQKLKIMNLFCLPEYSIMIGHYETTGLRSIFTLLSPM